MSKFDIDEALIRKLGSLLKETGLTELELEKDGQRIRVTSQAAPATVVHASPVVNAAPVAPAAAAPKEVSKNALTSPMVGTAYLSSEPGGTPFVNCDGINDCSDSLFEWWVTQGYDDPNDKLWFTFKTKVPAGTFGYTFDFVFCSAQNPMCTSIFSTWCSCTGSAVKAGGGLGSAMRTATWLSLSMAWSICCSSSSRRQVR